MHLKICFFCEKAALFITIVVHCKKTLLWFNCTSRQFMRILQIAELLLIRLCSICTAATLFYKWTIHERQGECRRENYVNFWKTVPSHNYAYPKNAFLPSSEDLRPKWQFCPPLENYCSIVETILKHRGNTNDFTWRQLAI